MNYPDYRVRLVDNNNKAKDESSWYKCSWLEKFFTREELEQVIAGKKCIAVDDDEYEITIYIGVDDGNTLVGKSV